MAHKHRYYVEIVRGLGLRIFCHDCKCSWKIKNRILVVSYALCYGVCIAGATLVICLGNRVGLYVSLLVLSLLVRPYWIPQLLAFIFNRYNRIEQLCGEQEEYDVLE